MKPNKRSIFSVATALLLAILGFGFSPLLKADVIILQSGVVITGRVLQQDASGVLLQLETGTYRYPLAWIKDVKKEPAAAPHVSNNGQVIPDWAQIVTLLANNGWARGMKQVPAAMIETGVWKNVPYISFRCGDGGYELNIFGDLDKPAAVQIGAMNYLHQTSDEKSNCVNFICSVLANAADRELVRTLSFEQKAGTNNGVMQFETILPGEWGSYGGWWVSICDTNALAHARATDAELLVLTLPRVAAAQPVPAPDTVAAPVAAASPPPAMTTDSGQITSSGTYSLASGWTAEELANARAATPAPAAPATGDKVYPRTYTRTEGGYSPRRR